jgi:uncharacterized RDD family membrane protein YckC
MSEPPSTVNERNLGVYYAPRDYAGFLARMLIIGIDLGVLFLFLFLWLVIGGVVYPDEFQLLVFASWAGAAFLYLTILEASACGTLGFYLTGMRIVNLRGERPSIFRMTGRLLIWVLGPIHPMIDLVWLGGDDYKQTLRDKIAGTYVVRKGAQPIGRGKIRSVQYHLLGMNLIVFEVKMAPSQ